ncbi:HalOD1 output domain-containing protein [Halopelagius fulvigenes]|uniref:HalOD1 output domain-containing protein n=1 Tax=Halopelagius fulvigenes TaxID=1198324 RepID=A0ABD5TZV8_9EURY
MNSPNENSSYRPSVAVVERVADHLDADPLALEPLSKAIDPDVLDAFADTGSVAPDAELRFSYLGCEIVVFGDGRVRLSHADPAGDPPETCE